MSQPAFQVQQLRAGGKSVPLLAGPNALDGLEAALASVGFGGRIWVVADRRVADLFGSYLATALPDAPRLEIDGSESNKGLPLVSQIWDWLVAGGAQRRDALLAFGGGVVCDAVGFAAACYMRGIGLINVPTTLLAQVDASVGGKTAVDHPGGKNLIGAFHQPLAVVADTRFLATLSRRALAEGMAEVTKIAFALDANLFEDVERLAGHVTAGAPANLTDVIARSIALKASVVERDERETGERMLLNYGHTIGHAVEAAAGYGTLMHGEAVAIGMRGAAHIASRHVGLPAAAVDRQAAVLCTLDLPRVATGLSPGDVIQRLLLDKKRAGSRQRWALPVRVGQAVIRDDVPEDLVREAVAMVLTAEHAPQQDRHRATAFRPPS